MDSILCTPVWLIVRQDKQAAKKKCHHRQISSLQFFGAENWGANKQRLHPGCSILDEYSNATPHDNLRCLKRYGILFNIYVEE